MKTLSPIITLLLGIASNFILGDGLFDGDVLMAQTPSERVQAAIESRNNPTTIIKEIERLEKLYENRPDIYVEELWRVVHVLWDCDRRDRSDQWHDLIDRLSTNIIDAKTKYCICKGLQIRVIVSYMRIDPNGSQVSIMKLRKERVSKILGIWQSVNNVIASCSGENSKDVVPFYHPLSPVLGPSPEMMNDPVLQKEYAEHLKKRDALLNESIDQSDAGLVVRNSRGQVKKYLIDSYSLHPFATAELAALLKEHKIDEALAKEVLDAVKEAEKNAPPPSDYRNWQTKDGLFKASAKYISSDGKDVTLEKPDSKQTTIELSALRKADQDYVRDQLAPAHVND